MPYAQKQLEVEVFDMINAMIEDRAGGAFKKYRNLLIYNEPVQRVFALIRRQFEIILNSKSMSESELGNADIAKKARSYAVVFYVSILTSGMRKFTCVMLVKALNSCIEIDTMHKGSNKAGNSQ